MDYEKIRSDFPALSDWIYLDTAFVGLYPRHVREGYNEFLDQWMRFDTYGKRTILNNWLDKTTKVRGMIATFIGARNNEIAFTMSTGSGLNIVINGTEWSKGDNVVFPVWEHNPLDTMTHIKDGKIELDDLEEAIDDKTKLVQIS